MIITACGYIAEARDDANRAELLSGSDDGGAASGAAASGGAVTPSATAGVEPVPSPTATPEPKTLYETYKNAPALTRVIIKGHTKKEIKEMFYVKKIPKKVWKDMQGKSYHKGCPVKKSGLRLIRVLYRGYDKKTYIGELVAAKRVSEEFKEIIYKLYKKKYQFGKIQRIDAYGGDDDASIADDNTSCFNHRVVAGSSNLSKHAYGIAIDINPLYNPYVCWVNGKMKVSPPKAKKYANRKKKFKHKITKQDLCYKYFHKKGYFWGGDWRTIKDYQHFQKQ
ncbi:MAG: M15 family metallopeptidase [Eubacterium sp.]|nr:M15 family metallopeptidase [Eubacterium sp.]